LDGAIPGMSAFEPILAVRNTRLPSLFAEPATGKIDQLRTYMGDQRTAGSVLNADIQAQLAACAPPAGVNS